MMDLKNEKITFEEIEELEAMEEVILDKQNEFNQEVLEWVTLEQIQFYLSYPPFDEIDREEAYVASKNILHEYLMER